MLLIENFLRLLTSNPHSQLKVWCQLFSHSERWSHFPHWRADQFTSLVGLFSHQLHCDWLSGVRVQPMVTCGAGSGWWLVSLAQDNIAVAENPAGTSVVTNWDSVSPWHCGHSAGVRLTAAQCNIVLQSGVWSLQHLITLSHCHTACCHSSPGVKLLRGSLFRVASLW